jgi:hypothetical protein
MNEIELFNKWRRDYITRFHKHPVKICLPPSKFEALSNELWYSVSGQPKPKNIFEFMLFGVHVITFGWSKYQKMLNNEIKYRKKHRIKSYFENSQ